MVRGDVQWNRPVRVKWVNELVDAHGNYLPHLLPVDPTLHWANPPGGTAGRDTRPTFDTTPGPYTGPVPIITHLHGAVGVGDESDGYPEAWFLPAANNTPVGLRHRGDLVQLLRRQSRCELWRRLGPRLCRFPISEPEPSLNALVSRPCARHDTAQRLCRSRRFLSKIPGIEVWQIGSEGGFLAAPVNLTATNRNRLLMTLAERADLIVDFTNVPAGNYVLANIGLDESYGGGEPSDAFDSADPDSTGQIMQFRVGPAIALDPTTPPQFLQLPAIAPLPTETVTRKLVLLEMMSMSWDEPAEAMLGTVDDAGEPMQKMWMEPVTENPAVGATGVWEIYNFTADAHPMHVHEVTFQVVNRQAPCDERGRGNCSSGPTKR
jgi:hypothetical protein